MTRGTIIRIVLLIGALVAAFWQFQQHARQAREYTQLQEHIQAKTHDLENGQTVLDDLEQQTRALLQKRQAGTNSTLRSLVRQRAAVTSTTSAAREAEQAEKKRVFRFTLADTLDNPQQQATNRLLLHNEIKIRTAAFARKLNLTPEQTEEFINLLVDFETRKTDRLAALLRDPTKVAEALQERDAAYRELQARLRSVLGDEGYAQYDKEGAQKQVTSQVERDLNMINHDLGASQLDPQQSERLAAILRAELNGLMVDDTDVFRTPQDWDQYFLSHADNIVRQAESFLTAEQLAALKKLAAADNAENQQNLAAKRKGLGL